jgi:hypothetical protein
MEVSLLAALLERHPTPWRVSRRRNLPISRSEAVEIADARCCRVLEVDSSTLADGLVEAVNLAASAIVPSEGFARIDPASPDTPDCVIPWRGQESLEAIEDSIS